MDTTNHVVLAGRVSGDPMTRTMPSGDLLVTFRVVVPRSRAAQRRSRQRVDTFEVSAWTARLRRTAAALRDGDRIVLTGELRRRFVRRATGPQSFVNIDLVTCRRQRAVAS